MTLLFLGLSNSELLVLSLIFIPVILIKIFKKPTSNKKIFKKPKNNKKWGISGLIGLLAVMMVFAYFNGKINSEQYFLEKEKVERIESEGKQSEELVLDEEQLAWQAEQDAWQVKGDAEQDAWQVKEANIDYTLLSRKNVGNYVNFNFTINEELETSDQMRNAALALKEKYCASSQCNVISLWKNKKSYELYIDKRTANEEPKWMKRNWVRISESLIFDYNVNVDEIILYPFIDDQYRRYGGKMKRPK